MNSREITTQISKAADFLNLKKWDYGASFSNDYSVQVDKGEAKQLKASQKQILTLRVWNESNLVGITTTSDISKSGIKKYINKVQLDFWYNSEMHHHYLHKLSHKNSQIDHYTEQILWIHGFLIVLLPLLLKY